MLRLFKRDKDKSNPTETVVSPTLKTTTEPAEKPSFFNRLRQGLTKTRKTLGQGLSNAILGKKVIDAALMEEIETQLLLADVGVATTEKLLTRVTDKLKRDQLSDPAALMPILLAEMEAILQPMAQPFTLSDHKPYVILVVGINGSGKTTTIGKLGHYFGEQGKQVMLAAGDTFRAAAVEQLQIWGDRNRIPVVAQQTGADSASVIYDALQSAKAKNIDVLIADTAGRLHTQQNLMEELKKIKRVLSKIDPTAPQEVLLVLDAGIGQNAINQAKQFKEAVGVTGIALTKLDGTAKGGIIFTIAEQLGIPLRMIGIGEQIDDLRPFTAKEFVEALFNEDSTDDRV